MIMARTHSKLPSNNPNQVDLEIGEMLKCLKFTFHILVQSYFFHFNKRVDESKLTIVFHFCVFAENAKSIFAQIDKHFEDSEDLVKTFCPDLIFPLKIPIG